MLWVRGFFTTKGDSSDLSVCVSPASLSAAWQPKLPQSSQQPVQQVHRRSTTANARLLVASIVLAVIMPTGTLVASKLASTPVQPIQNA